MIEEAYVSFETAKLLKEKGFDEPCEGFYVNSGVLSHTLSNTNNSKWDEDKSTIGYISAPTQQMAMKWLREVHNINIDIVSIWNQIRWEYQIFIITPTTAKCPYVDDTLYMGYEEAVEAALKYTLKNLI